MHKIISGVCEQKLHSVDRQITHILEIIIVGAAY